MKAEQAITHFGGQRKLSKALGINESNVSRWVSGNGVVPIGQALRLMNMAPGMLDICVSDYKNVRSK